MTFKNLHLIALALCTLPLAACDLLGLNDDARIAAAREAEGKAVGAACRYSARPLEECYGMNPKTSKAAIFAGWRDMDGYMRENNIQVVSPEGAEEPEPAKAGPAAEQAPKAAEAASPADEKPKAAEAPVRRKAASGPDTGAPIAVARLI